MPEQTGPFGTTTIAIAATFTAEPIEATLAFWLQECRLSARIEFAPYHQVFQQLLDPSSLLGRNTSGVNIILVRFEDWWRFEPDLRPAAGYGVEQVERNIRDLLLALKSMTERSQTPLLIGICPPAPLSVLDPDRAAFFQKKEAQLVTELATCTGIYLVTSRELAALYPVSDAYDPLGDELGHVPYTPVFFTALGTLLARRIYAIRNTPTKVIVLDCDQTLWRGVCGEDGVAGIEIDSDHQALQQFMLAQHDAGVLLCLCSKNEESTVWEVFERRPEMILKREHLAAWRVNWRPKSENLQSLAGELNLGFDSFIFVDDDALECAQVRASCPQVLTLQLPQAAAHLPRFLQHVWAFDRLRVTDEDRRRTELYQQNAARERLRAEALTFQDFLAGLELNVQISELTPSQLTRVAQLTQRTNQFNFTTLRRSESELRSQCLLGDKTCLVAHVSDRFGDYGLVGVIIFETQAHILVIDTFLLSCRVLGRGVEQRLLARLGQLARARGLERVEACYIPSGRNQPALDFLQIGRQFRVPSTEDFLFSFPADWAAALGDMPLVTEPSSFEPSSTAPVAAPLAAAPMAAATQANPESKSIRLDYIAQEWYDAELILKAIQQRQQHGRPQQKSVFVAPRTASEKTLAGIWADLLHLDEVGVHDNFAELGGDSLLSLRVVAQLSKAGLRLTPQQMLNHSTIAELADLIDAAATVPVEEQSGPTPSEIVTGEAPLTPSQAWFFRSAFPDPHWWNIAQLLKLNRSRVKAGLLAQAVAHLERQHDGLRARFVPAATGWRQILVPPAAGGLPFTHVDLSAVPAEDRTALLDAAKTQVQQSLDLTAGPLWRVVVFDPGTLRNYLLIVAHHLVMDEFSFQVLIEDLLTVYQRLAERAPVRGLSKTTALPVWAERARAYAESAELGRELARWQALAWAQTMPLPVDHAAGRAQNSMGSTGHVWTSLTAEETAVLLKDVPKVYNAQVVDGLLMALVESVAEWTGRRWVTVNMVNSGRTAGIPGTEDLDLSRTVGWLAMVGILLLERRETGDPAASLASIREQLRGLPKDGIPLHIITMSQAYGGQPRFPAHVQELFFNYLGRSDKPALAASGGQAVPLALGDLLNGACRTDPILGCLSSISSRRLILEWTYGANVYERTTVERLAASFMASLRALIAAAAQASGQVGR